MGRIVNPTLKSKVAVNRREAITSALEQTRALFGRHSPALPENADKIAQGILRICIRNKVPLFDIQDQLLRRNADHPVLAALKQRIFLLQLRKNRKIKKANKK